MIEIYGGTVANEEHRDNEDERHHQPEDTKDHSKHCCFKHSSVRLNGIQERPQKEAIELEGLARPNT